MMRDKVVLVTGANSGIGKATALELAGMGATVVMGCRREAPGRSALMEIQEITGNDRLDLMVFDLSVQESVKKAAEQFKSRYNQLDVLINNAGFMGYTDRRLTEDGIEAVMATNYLGPFILTATLLSLLEKSSDGRIINLSSYTHRLAKIDWKDFMFEKKYKPIQAYAKSKLMIILWTNYLAQKYSGSSLKVNAVDPGTVYTAIDKTYSPGFRIMYKLAAPFMASAKKGAATSVYLASNPAAANFNGLLFKNSKPVRPAKQALKSEDMRRLWEKSLLLTKLDDPFSVSEE